MWRWRYELTTGLAAQAEAIAQASKLGKMHLVPGISIALYGPRRIVSAEEKPAGISPANFGALHAGHKGDRRVHGKHGTDHNGDFPRPVEDAAPKRWRVF